MFDTTAITRKLESLYLQAQRNGLPPANCRAFASGEMHESLARIIRHWQDVKHDQEQGADSINGVDASGNYQPMYGMEELPTGDFRDHGEESANDELLHES